MRFLLDVNVLIALAFPSHSSHQAAHSWFRQEAGRMWATCPFTQGGFIRIASRIMGDSRQAVGEALGVLEEDCQSSAHEFWPADVDLRALGTSQRSRLIGPNQVADMQLLLLAYRHKGQLATFDGGIKEIAAGTRYANSLLLLKA